MKKTFYITHAIMIIVSVVVFTFCVKAGWFLGEELNKPKTNPNRVDMYEHNGHIYLDFGKSIVHDPDCRCTK